MSGMDESFSERFWRIVCQADRALATVLLAQLVFFLLLLYSVLTVEDPATAIVLQIDFAIVVTTSLLVGAVLWNCRRR